MSKYVFGPVPSRRLGQSLGIDPVPLKTCNWNCIYCQLGRSRPVTNQRKFYCDTLVVLEQVREALNAEHPDGIDWITFVGSGETTLHSGIGEMIRGVKALTDLPVAVITNGSLLYLPEVRDALLLADAVMPSIDAGSKELYKRIDRPHPDLDYRQWVDGLVSFREAYQNNLWVEVMLVRGINDTEEALADIAGVLERINPDEVHIVTPDRPPVEAWVKPPDEEGLMRAHAILGHVAKIIHSATGSFDLGDGTNLIDSIVEIITRHPMSESELVGTLERWSTEDIKATLDELREDSRAQIVERYGTRFWRAAGTYFPDQTGLGNH